MIEILLALSLSADWSPRLAADYLDSRQKEWFAWKTAQTADGPCVSCHTGVTYLMVRPELRRKLGESQPTSYETGLRKTLTGVGFKGGFLKEPLAPSTAGVQAIHSALFLGDFDRLWSLQIKEGKDKGAWKWFHLDLDPWEMPESTFYGATLAALAARNDTGHPEQIALLRDYLKREQATQPLHNRLMLLWSMPDLVGGNLMEEVLKKQEPDGGWTMESLGPWKGPARSAGSDAYATGLVTYTLLKNDNQSKRRLNGAINWLKTHQNREGFWPSTSMNKEYPADSMMVKFMQDAATGFAALALLEAERLSAP
jgi:squalene-hopene/tetraprenyl-beta-curcumene cyclase